jgi:protein-S-isoprenylcysteine O-methyltransferase Ste14
LALLLMFATDQLLPGVQLVTGEVRLLGCLPLLLGLGMNILADQALKRADTPVGPRARTTTLVSWSVYRWSRNPMYLGSIFMLSGIGLLLGSLIPALFPILFAVLMRTIFIGPEELKLQREFPEAWNRYAAQTRRWL